jgi:hypothetical protein
MSHKRLLCVSLLVALFTMLLPLAPVFAAPPAPPTAMAAPIERAPVAVRASVGLRLREGPSRADRVVLILRNGESVYPAGGPVWEDGLSWTFVHVYRGAHRYEGFCASLYLGGAASAPPEGGPTGGGYAKVVAGAGLRLRWGPGLGYGVGRVAANGTLLSPTGRTAWGNGYEWTEVTYRGVTYWAASQYLVGV